jgi:hypothetical protein
MYLVDSNPEYIATAHHAHVDFFFLRQTLGVCFLPASRPRSHHQAGETSSLGHA